MRRLKDDPFNPATVIKFNIKSFSAAEITIFNTACAEVSKEIFGMLSAGTYEYKWDASSMPTECITTGSVQLICKSAIFCLLILQFYR